MDGERPTDPFQVGPSGGSLDQYQGGHDGREDPGRPKGPRAGGLSGRAVGGVVWRGCRFSHGHERTGRQVRGRPPPDGISVLPPWYPPTGPLRVGMGGSPDGDGGAGPYTSPFQP